MSNQVTIKNRKALRNALAEVFSDRIKELPNELQYILLDDLVTAFENRLSTFTKIQSSQSTINFELAVDNEKVVA
ncbi:MAG: hypothetical protein ABSG33_05040 [Candidatus Bathyarchaeia archaeon]